MKFVKLILVVFVLSTTTVFSQDSTIVEAPQKEKFQWFEFNGYLKYMQSLSFQNIKQLNVDNLLHNRLNFKFYIPKGSMFSLEIRNRIFYGGTVKSVPNYGELVNSYDGVIPMEFNILDNSGFVINTIIDRLYYDYANTKFQIRIGRQRINWGINTTWNPNDIFNSYNIYDFDYEERQGSDALLLKFFPNFTSQVEFAYKFTGRWADDVFALKYLFNKKGYDFQFIAGKFRQDVALGFGWAGNIKMVGFKGEMTYFQNYKFQQLGHLSASAALDYSFSNGIYIMGTYMYNSTGVNHTINPVTQTIEVPNAKNLMTAKHNAMGTISYPFTPIIGGAFSVIYGFEINSLTLNPTLTFNVKQNLDLDLIGQIFFQESLNNKFENVGNGIFARLKWSF